MLYPQTEIVRNVDTLAGLSFPDPYRWLEADDARVRLWQSEQAALAEKCVQGDPLFRRVQELVERFGTEVHFDQVDLPRYAGGLWFRRENVPGARGVRAVVATEPMGDGRVVFDPALNDKSPRPFLSWISPSPDGCILAAGVCADGSERNRIRLVNTQTGELLLDAPEFTLLDANTGGVQWLPDSSGFFLTALVGAPQNFEQRVYLYRRLSAPSTQAIAIQWTTPSDYRLVVVSRDGRYAIALERCLTTIPVAVAALDREPLLWRPFITSVDATVSGEPVGENFVAVTDLGAPRGRVVAIPLHAENPNDPQCWKEIVPESEAVLRTVTPVGNTLYVTELVNTYSRVRILDLHGHSLGHVPLPGRGAVVSASIYPILDLIAKGPPDRFIFAFSSLTTSRGLYSHTPGDRALRTLQAPRVTLADVVVEDRWAESSDGERIPYHTVGRSAANASQAPRPTLLCAYGAYGAAFVPQFPGPMAAFIEAGGVFVHAHIRGGGEFGRDWWQSGRMLNKQNGYEDLYAVAEDLIATGRTRPDMLALTGESNGGLMVGVAITQRPELWAVAVPRVPMLDLIGACRTPYGRWCVTLEIAEIDDPESVQRLSKISPYHLVRDGVAYPAVFLCAGDTDPRCPPWHARKFAARLQRASSGRNAVLLHISENAGHGGATDRHLLLSEYAEWLTFTMRVLGLEPAS